MTTRIGAYIDAQWNGNIGMQTDDGQPLFDVLTAIFTVPSILVSAVVLTHVAISLGELFAFPIVVIASVLFGVGFAGGLSLVVCLALLVYRILPAVISFCLDPWQKS